MGWDGMGWDGMGWDGMGWDALSYNLLSSTAGAHPIKSYQVLSNPIQSYKNQKTHLKFAQNLQLRYICNYGSIGRKYR